MTTYRVWNGTSWEYIDNQNYDARYLLRSELGSSSGAASLDSGGHIPMVQVPSALTGAVNYQGTFNPIGGAPTPAGKGYYYVANTSGTVDTTAFATGDWLIYTDSFTWEKLDNTGSSVIWEHVVDKPASYPPSSHNNSAHSETYLTIDGMAANSTLWDGIGRPLFTGNATKYMRLNEAGDAFEFATVSAIVDIHGEDSTGEFSTGDEVLIYDSILGENRKILRGNFFNGLEGDYISIHGTFEETTPATNMELLVYDPSVPANRRMTRANFLYGISAVGAFTNLTDTPASYEGYDDTYYVRVNAASNALEFATVPSSYTLPVATDSILGGIKIGSRLTITDGVLSADEQSGTYTLPTASADVLGGVKIGSGITITDGVISLDISDVGYSDVATTATLPASPAEHKIYEFIGTGENWTLTANTGQYIRMLSTVSVVGGTIASTSGYDTVCLIYIGSNVWLVKSAMGILEVT